MNRKIASIAVISVLAGLIQAATTTQTQGTGQITPGSDTATTLTFNKFNTALGTLTEVSLTYTIATWGGSYSVANTTLPLPGTEVTGNAYLGASGYIVGSRVPDAISGNQIVASTSGAFDLPVNGNGYDLTGIPADYSHRISNSGGADADSGDFGLYTGAGTYTVTFHSGQYAANTSSGAVSYSGTAANSEGTLSIVYTYTPVPEPASLGLFAVGGLALFLRRRFSKKA